MSSWAEYLNCFTTDEYLYMHIYEYAAGSVIGVFAFILLQTGKCNWVVNIKIKLGNSKL